MLQWLSHSPCKPGLAGLSSGFSSPSDENINPSLHMIFRDKLVIRTYCDKAGDYAVPNVLSPRDLVFRPNLSTYTVHTLF